MQNAVSDNKKAILANGFDFWYNTLSEYRAEHTEDFKRSRGKVKIYLHKKFFDYKMYAEQKWKKLLAVGCGTIIHI